MLVKYVKSLQTAHKELAEKFITVSKSTDPDLYEPGRNEVLTGIVSRMVGMVRIAIATPQLWSSEHGTGIVRSLIESKIVLFWLCEKGSNETFDQFKEYGRGHLKLLKLHLEEYADKLPEVDTNLNEMIAALDSEVSKDLREEFQEIKLTPSFIKSMNIRKMAQDVDLLDDYNLIFAPASAQFHNEWSSLDRYALEPCREPLHRGHRIPKLNDGFEIGPQAMNFAISQLTELIEKYSQAMQDSSY